MRFMLFIKNNNVYTKQIFCTHNLIMKNKNGYHNKITSIKCEQNVNKIWLFISYPQSYPHYPQFLFKIICA